MYIQLRINYEYMHFTNDIMRVVLATLVYQDIVNLFRVPVMGDLQRKPPNGLSQMDVKTTLILSRSCCGKFEANRVKT